MPEPDSGCDMPNISEPEQPNHKLGITWDGGDESRVQALMAENQRLREALELIARDYWTRDRGAQMLQEMARKALA